MIRFAAIVLALCITGAAMAQTLPFAYPVTVGTVSAQAIGIDNQRKRIEFYNPNDTAKVAVCPTTNPRATPPTITCTVNGPGSITLLPYQSYRVDGVGGNPQVNTAWNAIASAGGSGLTIFEWE